MKSLSVSWGFTKMGPEGWEMIESAFLLYN